MADTEAQYCGAAEGVAPPAGGGAEQQQQQQQQDAPGKDTAEPASTVDGEKRLSDKDTAEPTSIVDGERWLSSDSGASPGPVVDDGTVGGEGRRSRDGGASRRSVVADTNIGTALNFLREVVVRVLPSAVIVFALGVLLGGLKNWAAFHLLNQAEATNWVQPWNETRERELGGAWDTQTYVEFMNESVHLFRDEFEHAPKYQSHWIWVYYIRKAVESSMVCAVPFFIIWALHGFHETKRITLICFVPFVLVSFCLYLTCAHMVTTVGRPGLGGVPDQGIVFGLIAVLGLLVIPLAGMRMKLTHIWKSVVFPFSVLVGSLIALQHLLPVVSEKVTNEWALVMFRVFGYTLMQEVCVGSVRMALRLVPLSDEELYRPEDKVFSVLPVDCLFGYWGRILLMELTQSGPIFCANIAIALGEFLARTTVVHRDKFYFRVIMSSAKRQQEFWQKNVRGMMRFRCSMITSHLFAEHLIIATAAGYYYASGIAPDMATHIFNCAVQFLTELVCDAVTLWWEIRRHELPIIPAWDMRQRYYGCVFGCFAIGFNIFAMSRSATYFCGMRSPQLADWVALKYCGAPRG